MVFSLEKYHFKTGSLFEGLSIKEYKLLKENMIKLEVKAGKVIFEEGSYSKGVYIIRKGKVKIYQTNKEGKEQIAYIYRKGEIMGYRSLLCNSRHSVSAAALEDCVLLFISEKHFMEELNQSPKLCRSLLVNLACEFSVLINKLSVFAQQPVRSRVALALLVLNEKYEKPGKEHLPVVVNLSRDDLANYSGTTVETLVRVLRSFKDDFIIITKGRKIIIMKPKELEKIVESY